MTAPTIEVVAALIRHAAARVLLVRKRGTAVFMQPGRAGARSGAVRPVWHR